MIWDFWRQGDLEGALASDLLDRLEVVIPKLVPDELTIPDLYLRRNLTRLVGVFTSSDAFKKSTYRRKCLNQLPPEKLRELALRTGVAVAATSFDERVEALATQKWDAGQFAGDFVEFFDLPSRFLPQRTEPRPDATRFTPATPENPVRIEAPYKPLKDYQTQVFYDASRVLEPPRARLIIQMPTGAGKTRTAMELLTHFLRETAPGTTVAWLAHSEELCEQAFRAFTEVWQHVGDSPLTAYRAWGSHQLPAHKGENGFVVTSFQKLYAAVQSGTTEASALREEVSLILVDEAHKAIAPTYRAAIRAMTADEVRIVGLTATPGRTFEEETEELATFFFRTLVGITAPEGQTVIQFLRGRGILSKAHYDPLHTSRTYELTPAQRRSLEEQLDFPKGFLQTIAEDDIRNIEILKKLLEECQADRRVLLFAASVAQSKFFTAVLMFLGIEAAHLDGSTDKVRRRHLIEDFKTGRVQVLCNYSVLSTGFDAPNTDVVLIARPTASPVLYSQMIGRGLRGPAIGGTETCKLIDVRDNIVGFGDQDRVYSRFEEYFV